MALVFFFDLSFRSSIVCCRYLSLALPSTGYIISFISSFNKSGCGVLRSGYSFLVKIRGLGNFMLKFLFPSSDSLYLMVFCFILFIYIHFLLYSWFFLYVLYCLFLRNLFVYFWVFILSSLIILFLSLWALSVVYPQEGLRVTCLRGVSFLTLSSLILFVYFTRPIKSSFCTCRSRSWSVCSFSAYRSSPRVRCSFPAVWPPW